MINKNDFLDYLLKCRDNPSIKLSYDEWDRFTWFVLNFSSTENSFKKGLKCVDNMITDYIKELQAFEKFNPNNKHKIEVLTRLQDKINAI